MTASRKATERARREEEERDVERQLVSDGMAPPAGVVAQWPSAAKAAAQIGVSTRELARLALTGEIQRARAGDGTWRYNPVHLTEYTDEALTRETEKPAELGPVELMRVAVDMLKQEQAHNRELMVQLVEPSRRLLEGLAAENRRITERCASLEQGRLDSLEVFERLMTEAHQRDLATQQFASAERRKQQVVGLLMEQAPRLIGQVGSLVGLTPRQRVQVDAAVSLLSKLDPAKLEALLTSGLLSEEEAADVRRIVNPPEPNGVSQPEEKAHAEQHTAPVS